MGNTYQSHYEGSNGTTPSSSKPEWMLILEAIASEKKCDLHPNAPQLWKARLRDYANGEIKRALLNYRGGEGPAGFPESDCIAEAIDRERHRKTEPRKFEACRENGCQDGWRPASREQFARYQRCQCLLDHIGGLK